jgi:hypothetical protein
MKSGSIVGKDNIIAALGEASVQAMLSWKATMQGRAATDTPVKSGRLLANIQGSIDSATANSHVIRVPLLRDEKGKNYGYMVKSKRTGKPLIRSMNKAGFAIYRNKINSILKAQGIDARFKPGGIQMSKGRVLGEINRFLGKIGGILKILPAIFLGG